MYVNEGKNWQKVFKQNYIAEISLNKFKAEKLTPLIIIPNFLVNHIIALGIYTSFSKPSWKYGGNAYQIIQVAGIPNINTFKGSKKYELNINSVTQISFDSAFNGYQIGLLLPEWFKDALVELWIYTGQAVEESLHQTLLEIKAQLQRIEDQYDFMGRQ